MTALAPYGRVMLAVLALLGLWVAINRARAAPPDGADMSLAPWYHSLKQPQSGGSCCSMADCRPTEWQERATGMWAFIGKRAFGDAAPDRWEPVPADAVINRMDNPEGRAVVCWTPRFGVLCFVKGPET